MQLKTPSIIRHRCGTCGAIFRSIQELTTHVTTRHAENQHRNDDGWSLTKEPKVRVARQGWKEQPHAL